MWNDPLVPDQVQAQYFLDAIAQLPVSFLAVDVEQEWADWNEWRRLRRGEISRLTQFIKPDRISASALAVVEYLRSKTTKPVLIYTRCTFVMEYAAPMLRWIGNWPVWLAQYPFANGEEAISWDELKRRIGNFDGPIFPRGWSVSSGWKFWQFTGDRFVLPGMGGNRADVNLFNGSADDLRAFIAAAELPKPPPEHPDRVWVAPNLTPNLRPVPSAAGGFGTVIGHALPERMLEVDGVEFDEQGRPWYRLSLYVASWLCKNTPS